MGSEVFRFMEQQACNKQAAHLGLHGYQIVARHSFIEKRMEQGAVYLQRLMEEGRHEEAIALMETDGWQGIPGLASAGDERESG